MSKYVRSVDELTEQFQLQAKFLVRGLNAFVNEFKGEAIHLAAVLRVLLHDTDESTSLLRSLGFETDYFLNTAHPRVPNNLASHHGLIVAQISEKGQGISIGIGLGKPIADIGTRARIIGDSSVAWMPKFVIGTSTSDYWVSFEKWWNEVVFVEQTTAKAKRGTLSRKQLVLAVANKEGGAHFDPELTGAYADMTRRGSLGIFSTGYGSSVPLRDPHLSGVAQVAFEVITGLHRWHPESTQEFVLTPKSPS